MKQRMWKTVALIVFSAATIRADALLVEVTVNTNTPGVWAYTIFNNEASGSPYYIASFTVPILAPVTVLETPDNWVYSTDSNSYVTWYSNLGPPYDSDIAPGSFLSGFLIRSDGASSHTVGATVWTWDHTLDDFGPISEPLNVAAPGPYIPVEVPEPSGWLLGSTGLLFAAVFAVRRR